jgi:hypothetical protein
MSDASYGKDRAWSDRYLPAVQRIVGPLLLAPAPFRVDATEATDLMVMTARDMRIACRVRRPGFAGPYGNEFTMRSRRYDSGAVTEIEKAVEVIRASEAGELPPRIVSDPDFYLCRWCEYRRRYWEADA